MKTTAQIAVCCIGIILMAGCRSNSGSCRPVDCGSPTEARRLVHRITLRSRPQPESVVHSYSCGISHFDGYIPINVSAERPLDDEKHNYRYTYHDGRLVTCTSLGDPEYVTDSIWYNDAGAPILNCQFSRGEIYQYLLASFDSGGRISSIYRYSKSFDLISRKQSPITREALE